MGQKGYNSLSLLNAHIDILDNLSSIEVAERFTNPQDRRRNEFGTFTEKMIFIKICYFIGLKFRQNLDVGHQKWSQPRKF